CPCERIRGAPVEESAHPETIFGACVLAHVEPEAPRLLHELVALVCRIGVDRLVHREPHKDGDVIDVKTARGVRNLDALLLRAVEDDSGAALRVRRRARAPAGLCPDSPLL